MADLYTQISNIIANHNEFGQIVDGVIAQENKYRTVGLLTDDALFASKVNDGGDIVTLRNWNPLEDREEFILTDDPADRGETAGIDMGKLAAWINHRGQGWSSMDLAADILAADPMSAIAARVGGYWAKREQKLVLDMLKGIYARNVAANGGDMVVGDGTAKLSTEMLIQAQEKTGDNYDIYDTLIVDRNQMSELQRSNKGFVPASESNIGFATYNGYKLVVDSSWAPVAGVHTSILCSSGAVKFGRGTKANPYAVVRDERAGNFAGQTTLIERKKFIMTVTGHSQTLVDPALTSPSNAEYALATTWHRVADRASVPLAFIRTATSTAPAAE